MRIRGPFATNAGMHAVWDAASFAQLDSYEDWEEKFLEDESIAEWIRQGKVVPINIGSDGVFEVEVRFQSAESPAVLTDRESQYLVVMSDLYRLVTAGKICVSGIEAIDADIGPDVGVIDAPAGEYAVQVALIGWDDEPNMRLADGTPSSDALPDFVVLINIQRSGTTYRTAVQTFSPPT